MPHTLQEILLLEERALAVQAQKRRAEAAASEEKLLERRAERARRMMAEAGVSAPAAASSGPASSSLPTAPATVVTDRRAWEEASRKLAANACKQAGSQASGARSSIPSANESAARQERIAAFMETIRKDGWSAAFGDPERSAQYDLDQRAEWTEQVAQREAADRAAESERERLEVLADQIREAAGQAGR